MHEGSEENKEKWDVSFSRARATRKKQGQRVQRARLSAHFCEILLFHYFSNLPTHLCPKLIITAFILNRLEKVQDRVGRAMVIYKIREEIGPKEEGGKRG